MYEREQLVTRFFLTVYSSFSPQSIRPSVTTAAEPINGRAGRGTTPHVKCTVTVAMQKCIVESHGLGRHDLACPRSVPSTYEATSLVPRRTSTAGSSHVRILLRTLHQPAAHGKMSYYPSRAAVCIDEHAYKGNELVARTRPASPECSLNVHHHRPWNRRPGPSTTT